MTPKQKLTIINLILCTIIVMGIVFLVDTMAARRQCAQTLRDYYHAPKHVIKKVCK